MATLCYETVENEEELFGCFRSPALIDGQRVSIGVTESCRIKETAVMRGFADENGDPFTWFGWKESLIATLRNVTTPAPYNHEWWAQHVSKPEWVTRLESAVLKLWIHYPQSADVAEAKEIGSRLGYDLTILERKSGEAVSNVSFLEKWEDVEFKHELAGIPVENRDLSQVIFLGAKSFYAGVSAQLTTTQELRKLAFGIAQEGDLKESQEFLAGYQLGSTRANDVCGDDYWEINERQSVAEILQGAWDSVEMCQSLHEVTAMIRSHLPDETKLYLQKNESAGAAFPERINKLYQKIGLKKGSPGRPSKSGK
jgi:hypothetical protein